jgi:hypothetical protein
MLSADRAGTLAREKTIPLMVEVRRPEEKHSLVSKLGKIDRVKVTGQAGEVRVYIYCDIPPSIGKLQTE